MFLVVFVKKETKKNLGCLQSLSTAPVSPKVSTQRIMRPPNLFENSSSSKRLESVTEKANSRSRRKDASDEAQLWSSIQSLVGDEDLLDSLAHSATTDVPPTRLVPPAQFRRPTPPSVSCYLPHHSSRVTGAGGNTS